MRDAEVEALQGAKAAAVGSMGVRDPMTMADPEHVGRCRVDAQGRFRFDRALDEGSLAEQFEAQFAVAKTWATDAYAVRAELTCDPERLELSLGVSWYSPALGQIVHGEQHEHPLEVDRRRERVAVTPEVLVTSLRGRYGVWHRQLVVHGLGS